ncbi:hypothetical protein PHYSODRAFT_247031 [Phytophthora sojae]|uniref:Uncharacterized protein n=1 Tax=Phytophthora sojae (strain P6497) TaxID=1094619 RepID=G4Z8S8_PHYSP|nr:hypothetical protein PHYSODRAFT_247031 [Phytophthora sojae]EGZ19110.1 hypothetical protein PHYSODRAFT_247031 [Phytophthora sojae]|eukprot:XP_009521827.1 hypothetical protein PHYSODRAFT_247031 [Phytophthora sojae]
MSDTNEDHARKFKAFLDQTQERLAQVAFWADMRQILAVNKGSRGLEILDDVAEALLKDPDHAAQALKGSVLILSDPSTQETVTEAAAHPIFGGKDKKRAATSPVQASSKSKKKSRPSSEWLEHLDFELRADTPKDVIRDIKAVYRHTRALGLEPYQRAFPWEHRHLFYDPLAYPDVYIAHWRFWHSYRKACFDWAFHVPLVDKNALTPRRKRKMNAMRERLRLWGGPTGKATPTGEATTLPAVRGLRYLFKKDKEAYRLRIRDATKPFQVDSPRFQTLTEMLVQTGALVPTAKHSHRLSGKALARVVLDITSPTPVPDHWVPSLTKGAMRALLADKTISELRVKVETQLGDGKFRPMKVNPYNAKEGGQAGVIPPYRPDGTPTARGPATTVDDSSPTFREEPDEIVAKMVVEAEAKPKRKASGELEYITTGEEAGAANEGEDGVSNDDDEVEDDESDEEEEELETDEIDE